MAQIDMSSVLGKVHEWEHSEKGQKRMRETLNKYARNNVTKTDAGSRVLTRKAMNDYGNKLIKAIKDSALSCDLPQSVSAHFDSLKRGHTTVLPDGSYVMEISFTDDLTRESLQPENYDGVRNIIAIFNNGYPADRSRSEAISHISGWWHDRNVTALAYRPGLHFMQKAVDDFNQVYGQKFGIYAELGEIYQSE